MIGIQSVLEVTNQTSTSFLIFLLTNSMTQDKRTTVGIFLMNGINCILGWNAVLASLDFFASSFQNYDIYSLIAIPLFIGNIVIACSYHQISIRFSYIKLIIAGNMTLNFCLLGMLLVSLFMPQSLSGFIILMGLSFLQGISGMLSQLTFYAMINYLSKNIVSKFTMGTAFSGLVMVFFRIILTLTFGTNSDSTIPIVLYFAIAIIFNTVDMVVNIFFCKSEVYMSKIECFIINKERIKQSKLYLSTQSVNFDENKIKLNDQNSLSNQSDQDIMTNKSYYVILYKTCSKIMPYPLLICVNFIVAITMFPSLSLKKQVQNINQTWLVIFYTLSYCIGDTLGKYFAQLKNSFNYNSLIYLFFARLFFFFPITMMALGKDKDEVLINNFFFPFLNLFLCAFTVGFCTNASFIMAFKVSPLAYKKYAGVLCGLAIQVGLMLGTVFQLGYSAIFGLN